MAKSSNKPKPKTKSVSKPRSKGQRKSSSLSPKRIVVGALILCALILVGYWVWNSIRNDSYHATDKTKLEGEVRTFLDKAVGNGTPVHTELTDRGCDSGSSVGIALYIHCDLFGYKYYKTSDPPQLDLRQVDATLRSAGWVKESESGQTLNDLQVTSSDEPGYASIHYLRDGLWLSIGLGRFNGGGPGTYQDSKIKDYIDQGRIAQPHPGETIFGISIQTEYWTCRNSSFFKLPCPQPPSEPRDF